MTSPPATSPDGPPPASSTSASGSGSNVRPQPASSPSSATKPADPTTSPSPLSETEQVAAIGDLLAGRLLQGVKDEEPSSGPERGADGRFLPAPADSDETPEAAPEPAQPLSEPKTLKDLAERLEIPPEKLYDLEITTGDGEAISLGALKDAWADRQQATRETAKREQGLDAREAALLADVRLLTSLGEELKGKVSPQTVARLRDQAAATEAAERSRMLAAMPELRDQSHFDAWRYRGGRAARRLRLPPE